MFHFRTAQNVLKALLFVLLGYFTFVVMSNAAKAQEFDGICRLIASGENGYKKTWSGVAISSTEILTVAHHGETGIVRAEFPEKHGEFTRLGVKARVLRSDKGKDLSLLSYEAPSWASVRAYEGVSLPDRVTIRGFVGDEPVTLQCPVFVRNRTVTGYRVETLSGRAIQGMSGAPLLTDEGIAGIQFGGTPELIDAVSVDTIRLFLEGK